MNSANAPLLAAVRRHWLIITVLTLLVGAGGTAWALARPAEYSSSTMVLLTAAPGTPYGGQGVGKAADTGLQTERVLAGAPTVLAEAAKATHDAPTAAQLASGLTVEIPPSTQIIKITFVSQNRAQAQAGAKAVGDAYLAARKGAIDEYRTKRLSELDTTRKAALASILDLAQKIATTKDAAQVTALRTQLEVATNQLTQTQSESSNVRADIATPGQVIAPANTPDRGSRLFDLAVGGASIVLGLLAGIGVALLLSLADSRIRSRQDLRGEIMLAQIPRGDLTAGEPVTATASGTPPDEAYRRMRLAVLATTGAPAAVVVSAVGTARPAAAVAANLAVSATHSGLSVCVVDAAIAAGADGATELLRVLPGRGLTDVLTGNVPLAGTLQRSEYGPQVLGPGTVSSALGAGALPVQPSQVIAELRAAFDLVVVVAPETSSAVAETLAATADGTVLVVTTDITKARAVAEARRGLESVRGRVLGAVLVDRRRVEAARAADVLSRARHNAGVSAEGRGR